MNGGSLRPVVAAGMLLGIGMGGFLDGILFHQLLQFHNMLSAKYPPTTVVNIEVNMFWDGVFHLITWSFTLAGMVLLWRTVGRGDAVLSGRALVGAAVAGWGLFNLLEGIIDHHLLELHHVREVSEHLVYDLAFLGSGVVLLIVGAVMIWSARRQIAISESARRNVTA